MVRMWNISAWALKAQAAFRSLSPASAVTAATVVLTALVAVQTGRLMWILAVPPGGVGASATPDPASRAAADLSILSRFDAFYRGEPSAGLPADGAGFQAAAGGAFQLFGVRAGPGGSAILAGPDGRQTSVGVGEAVAPGVVLAAVGRDFAILRRGGAEERLEFSAAAYAAPAPSVAAAAPAPPAPAAPGPASVATVDRGGVIGALGLRPRRVEGRVRGFEVVPRGAGTALAQAGLRAGDVILTINGLDVTVENQAEMTQELRDAPQAVIGFERDGRPMSVTLRTPS